MSTAARKLSVEPAAGPQVRLIKFGADRHAEPAIPPGAPRARLAAPLPNPTSECATDHPLTLVGSRRDCQLSIAHGEVSQIHFALVNTGRHVLICDLRSRTGTFVNNQKIDISVLRVGDTLRAGPVGVKFDFQMPPLDENVDDALKLPFPIQVRGTHHNLTLTNNAAVIGRRNTCHIVVDTPDVSLAHAVLFALNGKPLLYDLGSRSGTFVNGERVSCAWLAPGDRVSIGGEELTVAWEAPAIAIVSEAAAAPALAETESASDDSETEKDDDVDMRSQLPVGNAQDLEGLEAMINALQSQISASRAKLGERAKQLDAREADLLARETELSEARARVEAQQVDLASREEQALSTMAEAEAERKAIQETQGKLEQEKAALEKTRGELEAGRAQCAQAEQALKQKQSDLDAKIASHQKTLADLDKRDAALKQQAAEFATRSSGLETREKALSDREQSVEQREKAITDREAAEEAATRKIAVLKSALEQATHAFAEIDESTTSAAPAPAPAKPPKPRLIEPSRTDAVAAKAAPAKADARPNGAAPTRPAAQHAGGKNGAGSAPSGVTNLPAPVVDQPVFVSPQGAGAPNLDQFPPEWRERFRVLRRLSSKSDQELMDQVAAEFKAKGQSPQAAADNKTKRRWWS
ncbi:MAG: FHA domain-containing protein [Phycisphaerae bacterium]